MQVPKSPKKEARGMVSWGRCRVHSEPSGSHGHVGGAGLCLPTSAALGTTPNPPYPLRPSAAPRRGSATAREPSEASG